MNRQEFIDLGIDEKLADKAEKASQKELEGYIVKSEYDNLKTEKENAEKEVATRDKQIETLKESVTNDETLKTQIATLQQENKTNKEKYEQDLKDLKVSNAIKLALTGKVQDEDIVLNLLDKEKIVITNDGKIAGLNEQLDSIKKEKGFLFKEEQQQQQQKPGFQVGSNAGNNQQQPTTKMSLKESIAAKYEQQTV